MADTESGQGPSETPPPELVAIWKGEEPTGAETSPEETPSAEEIAPTEPPAEPEQPESEGDDESDEDKSEDEKSETRNKPGSRKYKERFEAQRRENEMLRQQNMQVMAQAAYLRGLAEGAGKLPPVDGQTEAAPDPDTFELGQIDPKYIEALTDYKLRQAMPQMEQRAVQRAQEMVEQERARAAYQQKLAAVKEQYPDFDAVIANSEVMVPKDSGLALAFLRSSHQPVLAYWLAQHPAETERLIGLDEWSCAEELGAIRAQITSAQRKPQPQALPSSAQRPPVRTVTGGTGVRGHTLYDAPDLATFKRLREAEEAAKP